MILSLPIKCICQYTQKQPGFTVEMLVVPNTLTNDQSFFNRVFFGVKNPPSQIPISTHRAESHQIKYVEYASEGLEGLEKTIDIPLDTEASLHPFVTQKTFYFGTDKYGRDLLSRILVGARISFSIGFCSGFYFASNWNFTRERRWLFWG